MARRATAIKKERAENKGIVLLLDAGNTLVGQWLSVQTDGRVMVEAMNLMGYDALTLGQMDLALGLDVLKERQAEAKFPFLSANLVSSSDLKPLFQPYVILERQGARIGIIGLSEPQAAQAPGISDVAIVLPPVEAARQYVGELRDQVDILIVLSHLGLEEDKTLAQVVSGIDIIVGGKTRQLMRQPEEVGHTLIVQQGYRGEWIGRLKASFAADGLPEDYSEDIITLGPEYADDPEMAELVRKWAVLYPSPTPVPQPTEPPAPTPTS